MRNRFPRFLVSIETSSSAAAASQRLRRCDIPRCRIDVPDHLGSYHTLHGHTTSWQGPHFRIPVPRNSEVYMVTTRPLC